MWLRSAVLILVSVPAFGSDAPVGSVIFADRLDPPPYRPLDTHEAAQVSSGQSIFVAQFAPAGFPETRGPVGIGPLFNASSCSACHSEGERGRGPTVDGVLPTALVIHLESRSTANGSEMEGDAIYGQALNTASSNGVQIEGVATVRYSEFAGYYYPFGGRWTLRVPHYQLSSLKRGPLSPTTVIKPRLAPALFGVGLLEAVPEAAIADGSGDHAGGREVGAPAWHVRQGIRSVGRFGWQGDSDSIREQAAIAFAREMGLTSKDRPEDDCTISEADCRRISSGSAPEIADESLDALVSFLRTLAVPASPSHPAEPSRGQRLFATLGCASCHRPRLPVDLGSADGSPRTDVIAAYTDLRLHDLGDEMADENVAGKKVPSRWRTAPLWGLGYRLKMESHPTFLHDGRARSAEEAILWHAGDAGESRRKFMDLGPRARDALLEWVETL